MMYEHLLYTLSFLYSQQMTNMSFSESATDIQKHFSCMGMKKTAKEEMM